MVCRVPSPSAAKTSGAAKSSGPAKKGTGTARTTRRSTAAPTDDAAITTAAEGISPEERTTAPADDDRTPDTVAAGSTPQEKTAAPVAQEPAEEHRTAPSSTEDSPVVDVEEVEYTPARAASAEDVADLVAPAGGEPEAPARDETATSRTAEDEDVDVVDQRPDSVDQPAGQAESQGLLNVPGAEFAEIPIHEVRENPRNPRTMFDEDELDELAYSLREVGVLQPVVVRPIPVTEDGESFELVMGERRWRAARRAGLISIPAIIRETSDDDLLRDALLENLHRTQLNPLEEANAYQQLLDDFGCTQDELGDRIGRSRPQITNTLRLLRLPALVQRRLASGAISAGHARALLSLDDPTLMEELAQRIVSEGLSVRAVERLVARGGQQQTPRTVRRSTYDPRVVDLTSRLSNRLEAPVRIDVGKRKGKITLEFTNLEDLERLIENMGLDVPVPERD